MVSPAPLFPAVSLLAFSYFLKEDKLSTAGWNFFAFRKNKQKPTTRTSSLNLRTVVSGILNNFAQASEQHSPVWHTVELEMETTVFIGV